ncbi:MAG TPA: ABC transporter ATP-binding protein [Clostridiaceae bacterium]|nr:ABC transporter ATP-binding protein [Clostridiaceae bacterium]
MSYLVKMENVKKTFGNFNALDGINLNVNPGEIHGFIGPNGAGKTTTIRILLGFYKANGGKASVFDYDCWKDSIKIHQKISYVPGDVMLWGNLTGGEVIDMLSNLGRRKISEKKKNRLIDNFNLDINKKCRNYSKGNRQKVALISAFLSDAELLILDEPTSGLDPLMEQVFQEFVLETKQQGKSILLSSHILSEVEKTCDVVSIIKEGKVIESGELSKLRHLTRMNFIVHSKENLGKLSDSKGVINYSFDEQTKSATFQVEPSNVNAVLALLSNYKLDNLEVYPQTLEDLFLNYYEN